jgi:hypothetical protein
MIGIRTPDNTVFLADCISGTGALEKYQITFIYDVGAYLQTLDMVEQMKAGMFVPAHSEATSDLGKIVGLNRNKVYEIADKLISVCSTPHDFETILKRIFDDFGLTMNFEQYVLVGSTVRSYLSWLKDKGRLNVVFKENRLLWQSV